MGCIYCATNQINGKIYIGKTINGLKYRSLQHKRETRGNSVFKLAIRKYGFYNFEFISLFESNNEEELYNIERILINLYDSKNKNIGYNIASGGGKNSGWKFSEESLKKLSDSHKKPRPQIRKQIIAYDKNDNLIGEFLGQKEVSEFFKVKIKSIGNNLTKRSNYVQTPLGKIKFMYKKII